MLLHSINVIKWLMGKRKYVQSNRRKRQNRLSADPDEVQGTEGFTTSVSGNMSLQLERQPNGLTHIVLTEGAVYTLNN